MSKRIRSMIDEIFSDMKMSAENLALRDELLANALARYEDTMAQGRSEEEAFEEVASSLEDVHGLLEEMKRMEDRPSQVRADEEPVPELKTGTEEEAERSEEAGETEDSEPQNDLGDTLNKTLSALGDFSKAIMPGAKKLAQEMDGMTGGMLGKLGRAAKKGVRGAQKAAEKALDKFGDQGELVFDFGPKKEAGQSQQPEADPAEKLNEDAAEADEESPAENSTEAFVSEFELPVDFKEPALDDVVTEDTVTEDAAMEEVEKEETQPIVGEDGEIDEELLSKAVEDVTREAEDVIRQAEAASGDKAQCKADEPEYTVRGEDEPINGKLVFPAAGLRGIDVQLDADDVRIVPAQGDVIETLWEMRSALGEPVVTMEDHKLVIRRRNPDVFKTFFSVFDKRGGKITICVPHGYAAAYKIHTTSGDVQLHGVDADDVQVNTTSGCVRIEPDVNTRAKRVAVTTVSGHARVSACADDVAVTTVSGDQFISCDALKVDVNVVSGKVYAEGAGDEWEISAVSGDVEMRCTAAPTKKVLISSMHANVRLALPDDIRGFAAEIKGPLGCEMVNEFGPDRYGTCALPIRMETMRGSMMITRL